MIELKNVSFAYSRGNPVLKGVSARFKSGRLYGIFGPNGCGKSTLLKLITGELAPDTGSISPRWNDPLERACRLAMVEQEIPGRIPLTVREVVALGRYPWMRRRKVSSDIEEILNELQLAPLAEKPYSHLSGGARCWPVLLLRTRRSCCWMNRPVRSTSAFSTNSTVFFGSLRAGESALS